MFRHVFLFALFIALIVSDIGSWTFDPLHMPGVAWADDDDDSDDNDDDNQNNDSDNRHDRDNVGRASRGIGQNGSWTSGEPLFKGIFTKKKKIKKKRRKAVKPPPPPARYAENEIIAFRLSESDLSVLLKQGFSVVEEYRLLENSAILRRLRIPNKMKITMAREIVRSVPTGGITDLNHFYRSESAFSKKCQGVDCPARHSINWPHLLSRHEACGSSVTLGMIDTGINEAHETFKGAQIEINRLSDKELNPSGARHGTAVAALLVGNPATRSPGLVPNSKLVAVDAFHQVRKDERADLFTLVRALDFLSSKDIGVLNLSLAGPDNLVLEDIINTLVVKQDIVVVSAVGNAGPHSKPAFPAAYETVLAVTAVDRNRKVFRRAGRGAHVDLAAPGVNVWTAASIRGARQKTGTSFAVPFVTAAAAMLREMNPDMNALAIRTELMRRAVDIGLPGFDDTFGSGLLNIEGLCNEDS